MLLGSSLLAQVGINADGSEPDSSAMLDVKSTERGFLPPRMTHSQIVSIENPANGLIIYCTDCSNSGTGALAMFINGAWFTLSDFLGGQGEAGGKMKSTGTIEAATGLWFDPNIGATNESGFMGLPGGITFLGPGHKGYWWSSYQNWMGDCYQQILSYDNSSVYADPMIYAQFGLSVRCLRDF